MYTNTIKRVTKTHTCFYGTGAGAKAENLFQLTGKVRIKKIWGILTEVTDNTTLSNVSLASYDGTLTTDISVAAGTDLSGALASINTLVYLVAPASALTIVLSDTGTVSPFVDPALLTLTKKNGVDTYIQILYTADATTDVDIKWYIDYEPISDDGVIVAV